MINTKERLFSCLKYEKQIYSDYMFNSKARFVMSRIKREPARMIYAYIRYSRHADYYQSTREGIPFLNSLLYLYFTIKKNRLGEKLGLEVSTKNIEEGLLIYHYNNVVNGYSIIGKNCHLHGDNCIGNNGKSNVCPTLGDNVSVGVGAKIIGEVTIANDVKIAAGAVVVTSFLESGITIGGIPAKKIK